MRRQDLLGGLVTATVLCLMFLFGVPARALPPLPPKTDFEFSYMLEDTRRTITLHYDLAQKFGQRVWVHDTDHDALERILLPEIVGEYLTREVTDRNNILANWPQDKSYSGTCHGKLTMALDVGGKKGSWKVCPVGEAEAIPIKKVRAWFGYLTGEIDFAFRKMTGKNI